MSRPTHPPISTARTRLAVALALLVTLLPVGGGVWVWDGVATARLADASRHWPVVRGVVLSAERDASWSPPPRRPSGDARRWREHRVTYNTAVLVQYTVGDSTYRTRIRTFGQTLGSSDGSESELVRRRYPVGATVPVSHAPDDPAQAVLEPGFASEALALPVAGFAINYMIVLVLLLLVVSLSDRPYMRVPVTLFGLGFQIAGLGIAAALLPEVMQAVRASDWPTVPGRIVYGTLIDTTGAQLALADTLELRGGHDPTRVVFRYVVRDSVRYARQRVRPPDESGDRDSALAPWRYGLGQPVSVHVDPRDAANAVVDTGLYAWHAWVAGAVLALLGFGWVAQRVVARQVDS